ncbi:cytochrome c oxidase assembly protein subunit 11 [Mesorhizobium sp. J18]|uniref:cytochrome c oxidase assembly protein n=1 Tax=Mesorhizobium sp. J18 TaxID=935263 RepID=UPI0011995D07|nr:cytochrome c oxidase assembly protein [Mesorhizobium sp. J18]TWG89651.1 cytochrome c oxidase assembly protein subunit 11 [Mesorhizobium sp. J18]
MTEARKQPAEERRHRNNRVIAAVCLAFFGGMIGMAYAAVPLYQLFCQVTGYGGTTQRVDQYSDRVLDQEITVRFDANTTGGLPWEFRPEQRHISMPIGETVQVAYFAKNNSTRPTRGRASFNVAPAMAGAYFNKVECFCFTDQELKPGGSLDMPVIFYIDPDIVNVPELKNVKTITLSYTFFPLNEDKPVAASSNKDASADSNIGG